MFQKNKNFIIVLVFITMFVIGCFCFKSYGISYDDPNNRNFGYYNLNLISNFFGVAGQSCPEFSCQVTIKNHLNIHGPFFEIFLVIIEKVFFISDNYKMIYLTRHFLTFLLFFIGLIFFYLLCQKYFKNWLLSISAVIFLFASPRIFADSFYNSVDIGALVGFIIASYTFFLLLEKITTKRLIIHAVVCAIAIDTRITNALILFVTSVYLIFLLYQSKKPIERFRLVKQILIFAAVSLLSIILFWPYLWENPLLLFDSLVNSTTFDIGILTMFDDVVVKANKIPWSYNFVWIAISTPIFYLALFLIGFPIMVFKIFINGNNRIQNMYIFVSFLLPLILVIAFKTSLYNGWRHMFFIYPSFIMIVIIGLKNAYFFLKKINIFAMRIFIVITIFSFSNIVYNMIKIHPFEYVYFNSIAPNMNTICSGFDKDYWAMSYKQAFEYILEHDSRPMITFDVLYIQGIKSLSMLDPIESRRLRKNTSGTPDYFIKSAFLTKNCNLPSISKYIHTFNVNDVPFVHIIRFK